ncbi:glycosyltransferase [Variovorax sp. W6]|uniref:glycosyltransferase n=1 Tax=Variovorax sp. W6 TaxID=3093895 RepID=UPI003D8009E5
MRVLLDLRVSKSAADGSDAQRALELTFSKALALALHERHDTHILLDGRFSESVSEARSKLIGILPPASIHLWQSLPAESLQTAAAHEASEYLSGAVIARLHPDVVYTLAPDTAPQPGAKPSVPVVIARALPRKTSITNDAPVSAELTEAVRLAVEDIEKAASDAISPPALPGKRPRLAYVSPLPPQRSGIADYSAELLPELAKFYDLELIVDTQRLKSPELSQAFPVRDGAYLIAHADSYDRVLYHIGNSEFHEYMFELLETVPGTVVLHDFFLGDAQWHLEFLCGRYRGLERALYDSHGYQALADRNRIGDVSTVVSRYPCSFEVIRRAQGIIFHSNYSLGLMKHWYAAASAPQTTLIPLLRRPAESHDPESREEDRRALGLTDDDFLVCAFGLLGITKLNDRLLRAWKNSPLGIDPRCRLVFVGDNGQDAYGDAIRSAINDLPLPNVHITGWADEATFRRYLRATDVAVQLRGRSRGETSAAVLDTMNHGVATIANAHGAMAWLPKDSLCMLEDEFTDAQLTEALQQLWQDVEGRKALGARARRYINEHHSPERCGQQYVQAIEQFARSRDHGRDALITRMAKIAPALNAEEKNTVASAIAANFPSPRPAKQLLLDVSSMVYQDLHTGIQRVVKSLLRELIESPPEGFRVEPVYGDSQRLGYRYARRYTLKFLGCPEDTLEDTPISYGEGDHFIGLDLMHDPVYFQAPYFRQMRNAGVRVQFVVYDLLPVLMKHRFPEGSAALHARWLRTIAEFDGALCISQAVANELKEWVADNAPHRSNELQVRSFPLGADLSTVASKGLPPSAGPAMRAIAARTSFLMVGTVEPRKGHSVALDAFETLWAEGLDVNLVIVGKQGWMVEELAERLRKHPEQGERLIWVEKASDEYLELVYSASPCLITASEGEGFGLPLIEGAQRGLSLIARDLPVFREVCGDCALYFSGDARALSDAVRQWLAQTQEGTQVRSEDLHYLNWRQSSQRFVEAAFWDTPPAG